MQHCFLFQKSCKNQFSFFWELCLQKIFQKFIWIHHLSSKNDRDCIYQPKFGLEFNALIFNLSFQFFDLMIHSRTPGFNFSTSGFLRVFLNLRIRSWTPGINFEHKDSILSLRIRSWTPGLNFRAWGLNFELEDLLLNSRLFLLLFLFFSFSFFFSFFLPSWILNCKKMKTKEISIAKESKTIMKISFALWVLLVNTGLTVFCQLTNLCLGLDREWICMLFLGFRSYERQSQVVLKFERMLANLSWRTSL